MHTETLPWNIRRMPSSGEFEIHAEKDGLKLHTWIGNFDPSSQLENPEDTAAELILRWNAFPALVEALRIAIPTIEGLVDQQAMPDEWWEEPLSTIKQTLAAANPEKV